MPVFLLQVKAILDHLTGKLLIKSSQDLSTVMHGINMLARTSSETALGEGWKIFCEQCLPTTGLTQETVEKFVTYLSDRRSNSGIAGASELIHAGLKR
jgi:hypothetical protein